MALAGTTGGRASPSAVGTWAGTARRSLGAKLSETLSLDDYGAVGDWNGTTGTNDYTAISNAIAAAAAAEVPLVIPGRQFYIGSYSSHGIIYNITGIPEIIAHTGAKIVLNTTASVTPMVFGLDVANGFRLSGDLTFEDAGYNPAIDWKGAYGLVINPTVGDCTNLDITVKGKNVVGALLFRLMTYEIRNARIQVEFDNVYYGFLAQSCGDNVIGQIRGTAAKRSYFVHGVRNHKIQLVHKNPNDAQSDIVIKQYARQLENVEVDAVIHGTETGHSQRLRLEIESDGAATMRNVAVRVEQRDVDIPVGVAFSMYTASTVVDSGGTKKFEDIRITSRDLGWDPIWTVSGVPAQDIIVDTDEPTLQMMIARDSFPANYVTFRSGDTLARQVMGDGTNGLNTKSVKFDLRPLNGRTIFGELTVCAIDGTNRTLVQYHVLTTCTANVAAIVGTPVAFGQVSTGTASTTTLAVTGGYLTVASSYAGVFGRLFCRLRIA